MDNKGISYLVYFIFILFQHENTKRLISSNYEVVIRILPADPRALAVARTSKFSLTR